MTKEKFKIIAHRGLLYGPNVFVENRRETIINVLTSTYYDIEVDVQQFFPNGDIVIGHDCSQSVINLNTLPVGSANRMWFHSKEKRAFFEMIKHGYNTFMHDLDDCALTSKGYFWNYPSNPIDELPNPKSIIMPDDDVLDSKGNWRSNSRMIDNSFVSFIVNNFAGICTKYPELWQEHIEDSLMEIKI